jgi:hypothetical protein
VQYLFIRKHLDLPIGCFSDSTELCKAEEDKNGISWSATATGESDSQLCMKGYAGERREATGQIKSTPEDTYTDATNHV